MVKGTITIFLLVQTKRQNKRPYSLLYSTSENGCYISKFLSVLLQYQFDENDPMQAV